MLTALQIFRLCLCSPFVFSTTRNFKNSTISFPWEYFALIKLFNPLWRKVDVVGGISTLLQVLQSARYCPICVKLLSMVSYPQVTSKAKLREWPFTLFGRSSFLALWHCDVSKWGKVENQYFDE